jgi:transcriptional regulator with XRE-family HTH domain
MVRPWFTDPMEQDWQEQMVSLGAFIRTRRELADLSLRQLAALTSISNAYLSQLERGRHQPSMRVLTTIAEALGLPADELFARAGVLKTGDDQPDPGPVAPPPGPAATEAAIMADPTLTDVQRQALLAVYRSFSNLGAGL